MPAGFRCHILAALLCSIGLAGFALAMPASAGPTASSSGVGYARIEGAPPAATVTANVTTTAAVSPTASAPQAMVRVNQTDDSKFPQVTSYVGVTGQGGAPIAGLRDTDFALTEDGAPVSRFELSAAVNTQEPLFVALVVDISGSMEGKSLDYARQAAISFLDTLGPRDAVALISFSTVVKINQTFTTTKPIVARGIENLRAGGDTALYDAVVAAGDTLAQLGPGRKLAVLLSDGQDTSSRRTLAATLAAVASRRVPIFPVGLGEGVDRALLDGIAAQSGGTALYAPSALDLLKAYRTIGDQLRSQYVLRFVSGLKADASEHKVGVRLNSATAVGEGQGAFTAKQNAPFLDIVEPGPAQVLTTTHQVTANAQPGAPGATIQRVDFAVDGQVFGSAKAAPYTTTLDVPRLASGPHVLRVSVLDSAGNTMSGEVGFAVQHPAPVVEATPTPERIPTPVPEPEPVPVPKQEPDLPILIGIVLAFGLALALLVARRRRRPSTTTCRRCGTLYDSAYCPTCAAEDREWLRRRLHEVTTDRQQPPAGPATR